MVEKNYPKGSVFYDKYGGYQIKIIQSDNFSTLTSIGETKEKAARVLLDALYQLQNINNKR